MIIGGLVVFLASDYIFPPEDQNTESAAPVLKKRPRPNKKNNTAESSDAAGGEKPATETTVAEGSTTEATEPSTTVETAPESSVEVTSNDSGSETAPVTEPTPEATIETPTTETTVTESTTPSEPVIEPSTDIVTEEPSPSTTVPPVVSTDTVDDTVKGGNDNLTDQILQDLEKQAKSNPPKEVKKEYVAPPDYEYTGRGLVYNCLGKHWACVDAPSYKTCENNSSSTKFLGKKTECYPFNVYENTKGCENVQNRMVSSSAKTGFCNE